jgi:glutamate-ammonia-ligase adenylyltransferase
MFEPEGVVEESRRPRDHRRRKFVNVFVVRPEATPVPDNAWAKYTSELIDLLRLAEDNRTGEAQGKLVKRVARAVRERPFIKSTPVPTLLPVEIDIDNESDPECTVMQIRAEDTTGFLYELSNSLAVSGVSIHRVRIRSERNEVLDTLHVVDDAGQKITDPLRLSELRAAVVLTKHFTHLLPQSPNPESALVQFREFLEHLFRQPNWLEQLGSLQQTEVLSALAQLLGVSEFLWHDFLRLQHENLFPVVADVQGLKQAKSLKELRKELSKALATAKDDDARYAALNAFKDREMLRVDMRHILNLQDKFIEFSRELTDVAEAVVSAAVELAENPLRAAHGIPQIVSENGATSTCRLAVCALGKCGGIELGYASDIELMFVYEADGRTSGPERITNAEYFQKLVDRFRLVIHAKRKGIFEIDLRLRPYGKAGSLAVSLETFEKYFGPEGAAWPYERQALVKLRCIAGDLDFGDTVVKVRDALIYSGRPFDVAAMRGMREKQNRQLVRAGTFNAKLSPGGLVDCEYLVQGLQITYGDRAPSLRATNTREAMKALERAKILTTAERLRLRDTYRFLRRLIDALRMVRGDARDLTVPPADSEEFEFLARRLGYRTDVAQLSRDLEEHVHNVIELSRLLEEHVANAKQT